MPFIMIECNLAIPLMVSQKPVMFQDTTNETTLYNTLSGEKDLIKCRFTVSTKKMGRGEGFLFVFVFFSFLFVFVFFGFYIR